MSASTLLKKLEQLGVQVTVAGDRLRFQPASVIPPDLRDEVRARKAELLGLLARPELVDGPPEWHARQVAQAVRQAGICFFWSELFQETVAFALNEYYVAQVPQGTVAYREDELRHLFGEAKAMPSDNVLKLIHAAKKAANAKVTGCEPGEGGQGAAG